MNLATDMSLWGLVAQSSALVKGVLLLLLLASIGSWIVIFGKRRLFKRTRAEMEWFEDEFWSGGNLRDIYTQICSLDNDDSGMPALFRSGYEELRRQRNQGHADPGAVVQSVQRAMRVMMSRELEKLDSGLTFLATGGGVSPYVGPVGAGGRVVAA